METFAPGDRVVAINTDLSRALCGPDGPELHPFRFPDGPLRQGPVYFVTAVFSSVDGNQGLALAGLRVFWESRELPWNSSRFRKVLPKAARTLGRRKNRAMA
jgi:hypothetical protein